MNHVHASRTPSPAQAPALYPRLALPKLEAVFADGTRIWLQQVDVDPLVREVDDGGTRLRVNLREIDATLHAAVFEAARIDQAGIIFFTLRTHFASAEAFLARARGVLQ